jgi:hypothetical protein
VQPGADRAGRDAERFGDLRRFEPGPRDEQQRVAVGRAELGERPRQLRGAGLGVDLLRDAAVVPGGVAVADPREPRGRR